MALVSVAMFVCCIFIGAVQLHNTSELELAQFGRLGAAWIRMCAVQHK